MFPPASPPLSECVSAAVGVNDPRGCKSKPRTCCQAVMRSQSGAVRRIPPPLIGSLAHWLIGCIGRRAQIHTHTQTHSPPPSPPLRPPVPKTLEGSGPCLCGNVALTKRPKTLMSGCQSSTPLVSMATCPLSAQLPFKLEHLQCSVLREHLC